MSDTTAVGGAARWVAHNVVYDVTRHAIGNTIDFITAVITVQ